MSKLSEAYDKLEKKVDGKITHPALKPLRDNPMTAAVLIAVLLGVVVLMLVFGEVPEWPE